MLTPVSETMNKNVAQGLSILDCRTHDANGNGDGFWSQDRASPLISP
jgi:hypothetical protein